MKLLSLIFLNVCHFRDLECNHLLVDTIKETGSSVMAKNSKTTVIVNENNVALVETQIEAGYVIYGA